MDRIARAAARRLELQPGVKIGLHVLDEGLEATLGSLLASVGAVTAAATPEASPDTAPGGTGLLDGAFVQFAAVAPPIEEAAREMVRDVSPGRTVVFILAAVGPGNPDALAQRWAPCLDLASAHAEVVDGALVISGRRRPPVAAADRKQLRGLGHGLDASVLVGRAGVSADVVAAARAAVERHGLIKVKLTTQCEQDKNEALAALAWGVGAHLVQRVGRTGLLFRPDVHLDPPVARSGRR